MEFRKADFPHLSEPEWAAFRRLHASQGDDAMVAQFVPLSPEEQRVTLARFMETELGEALERLRTLEAAPRESSLSTALPPQPSAAPDHGRRNVPLKVDVAKYRGTDRESLPRWLVELDAAVEAWCIDSDARKVTFAMSHLAGRAKTWAFGRRLADENCFLTYKSFKEDLKAAFEPPKTEFRARTEFLSLRQGKRDVMTYAQHARYLVSCVTQDPIDDMTQVNVFMLGLVDGPAKTQLFREYPGTLEDAIAIALREDFSRNQAYVNSATYKPPRTQIAHEFDTAEPMDLSEAEAEAQTTTSTSEEEAEALDYAQTSQTTSKHVLCSRCQQRGHWSYECVAPYPVPRKKQQPGRKGQPWWRGKKRTDSKSSSREPKNDKGQ